jgi:hypothetical protein
MKIKLFSLIYFVSLCTTAQLYVSSNSYIYANDQVVYVKSDVNLNNSTSNFYLRNNAQLLQGTSGTSNNAGTGNLSVYQEGTVNNYQYNYWCSPVGSVTSSTGNNPFSLSQVGVPNVSLNPISFNPATLVSAWDGASSNGSLSISTRWIYKFVASNTYANWIHVGSGNIEPGLGFCMKGTGGSDALIPFTGATANNPGSAQRYDFRGKPNDGTISNIVSAGNLTLVGNPYPSTIDLNMFLGKDGPGPDTLWGTADDIGSINNPSIDGVAYFWEQVNKNTHYISGYEGGYGTYTPAGGYKRADVWSYKGDGSLNVNLNPDGGANDEDGSNFERRFTPVGQGFMVKGIAAGTVSMQNKFRVFVKEGVANKSQFARVSSQNRIQESESEFFDEIPNVAGTDYTKQKKHPFAPQIRIKVLVNDNQGVIWTALGFADGFTDGFDHAADAPSISASSPFSFYNVLDGATEEFGMSLTKFDLNKGYPVAFRNKATTKFKLKVYETLYGFDNSQKIFMHDKLTNVYHDIKNGVFEIELPAGNLKDRFEITFTDGKLSNDDNDVAYFEVFQNNKNKMLTIKNPELLSIKECKLFDVSGKIIFAKLDLGNGESYEFATSNLSTGVYVVRMLTENNQQIVKKVTITNN